MKGLFTESISYEESLTCQFVKFVVSLSLKQYRYIFGDETRIFRLIKVENDNNTII